MYGLICCFSPVIYKPWLDSVIINKVLIFFLSSKSATDSSHAHWHLTLIRYSTLSHLVSTQHGLDGKSGFHGNTMCFWLFEKLSEV